MASKTFSVEQFSKSRTELLSKGDCWRDFDEKQSAAGMKTLSNLEDKILKCSFSTEADKLSALKILLENDDCPEFADEFKNRLFAALQ